MRRKEKIVFIEAFLVSKVLTYTPKVYIIMGVKIMYAFSVYKYSIYKQNGL